ncbi:efflux RND transporter permease subunit [Acetobacter oeni]|uniref:Transport system membrane protein n=1 Tax=Acetobacter oeni TaxID=304077 RepID=A0A511XPC5_9PROT|nr:efflux RND transporter permease subunit [Acetobacter oeni]MBB3884198.1 multidrug efflux pump [Acetobacter oeni]NHO20287.1 MMPL family transporter [Acetobacter oeni]GBR03641.1 multidrug efflux pump acriflavin resistance protein AcrB/AcrD/AcrF [Acetobacter oeni LMG 21952]GEN64805.1 transport system membrane protein [Acetobacter oeni]
MSLVALCIRRPVGTTLIVLGLMMAGMLGYLLLPIADLPNVDLPVIQVQAQQAGGTPEEIASTIAEPLERHLGTISGLTEMTSQSVTGQVNISLQFDTSRDVNSAARDVQAAIHAARADLPATLRQDPTYHEANTAGMPILILALTSKTRTPAKIYDAATNILEQHLSQISGVGQVELGGGALPAVRVEMNPLKIFKYGIGFEDIRAALAAANANTPKGFLTRDNQRIILRTNDQVQSAKDLKGLIVAYRNMRPVRLEDIATVSDGVEDVENGGFYNGERAVLVIIFPRTGANIVQTIDQIKAQFPFLTAALPADVELHVGMDRSFTIRAALADTKNTLFLSVVLVVAVVLVFLRSPRTTLVPAVVIPASLITTFGVMELLHYSLDNLSLMALTISTGFVVDDAIVVIENISRHMEKGETRAVAVLAGAQEVAFTVLSVSISLIAVFFPILMLGGLIGNVLHEFAVTISVTVLVSMGLSLTLTPMMCSRVLRISDVLHTDSSKRDLWTRISVWLEHVFEGLQHAYEKSLLVALRHRRLVILSLPVTIAIMAVLFVRMPRGLLPTTDSGTMMAHLTADQAISFQAMMQKITVVEKRILANKDVVSVTGFVGGRTAANQSNMFIELKDKTERHLPVQETMVDLRRQTYDVAGAQFIAMLPSLLPSGARMSNGAYQYSLQSSDATTLYDWMPRLQAALERHHELADISTDVQRGGLATTVDIKRDLAGRTELTPQLVTNALYDAFGQRAASVIYNPLTQYRVVMNVQARYWEDSDMLRRTWVSASGGTASGSTQSNTIRMSTSDTSSTSSSSSQSFTNSIKNSLAGGTGASSGSAVSSSSETLVPLSVVSEIQDGITSLTVNHQGQALAATLSFNLASGASMSDAVRIINEEMVKLKMPATIHGSFAGTAAQFQSSTSSEPLLIVAALAAVYMVLGILYESFVHPLTILSTLPSAGVGALLALYLFGQEFDVIALIGLILLIGIVKKNAIMLVDFAINAERHGNLSSEEAIHTACLLRFRPILMTTIAAAMGALPLVMGNGYGSELRRPLGISIVGGLLFSQILTLYTTPVIYLYLDGFGRKMRRMLGSFFRTLSQIFYPARS